MGVCVHSASYVIAEGIRFLATEGAAGIRSGVAIAEAATNAADAISNYRKLSDVSSRGISIEEDQFNHVRDVYWAQENNFLNEFTQPTPWETKAVLAKRYAGRMWAPIAGAYAKKFKELECDKIRYCGTAYKRALEELLVSRSTTKANIESLADRIAFYEIEQIRETDFERRKQAIVLRKGLIGQASSLMASATRGLAEAGASSMNNANEALRALGYFRQQARQQSRGQQQQQSRRDGGAPVEDRSTYSSDSLSDLAASEGFSPNMDSYSPGMNTDSYVPDFDTGAGPGLQSSFGSNPFDNVTGNALDFSSPFEQSALIAPNQVGGVNAGDGSALGV